MSEMTELVHKEDIVDVNKKIESLKKDLRNFAISFVEKTDKDKSEIIGAIFSEHKKIRELIGYQNIILKTLEDNLNEMIFDEDTGISSKIEISVGTEVFGTGAKWVLDLDLAKASYKDILQSILNLPAVPDKIKVKVEKKLEKFLSSS